MYNLREVPYSSPSNLRSRSWTFGIGNGYLLILVFKFSGNRNKSDWAILLMENEGRCHPFRMVAFL